jgi:hypothetical protein
MSRPFFVARLGRLLLCIGKNQVLSVALCDFPIELFGFWIHTQLFRASPKKAHQNRAHS